MDCTIHVAKRKALISCALTAQLICAFVFAYSDCWFSDAAAHMVTLTLACTVATDFSLFTEGTNNANNKMKSDTIAIFSATAIRHVFSEASVFFIFLSFFNYSHRYL